MNLKKRNLFTYGDSFTDGHRKDSPFTWFVKWYELNNYLPPNWNEILAEELNYNLVNYGILGNSNQQIFDDFCETCNQIEKNDVVIIEWTYNTRFRWASDNGWVKYSTITLDNVYDPTLLSTDTLKEILVNRDHKLYCEELLNYENLIEQYAKAKGFDVYFWALDSVNIYNQSIEKLQQRKYICNDLIIPHLNELSVNSMFSPMVNYITKKMGGKFIVEETNGIIGDGSHFGESGHKALAEIFYNYIKENLVRKFI